MRLRLFALGLALAGLVAGGGSVSAEVQTPNRDMQAAAAAAAGPARSVWNNKCLQAFGNYNTALVGMNTCNGAANQQWYWDGAQIRSAQGGNRCLEVLNFDILNGAYVGLYDCWGGTNQQWYYDNGQVRTYLVDLLGQNKCLEIYNWDNSNGARAGMWTCWGTSNQLWY